MDFVAIMEAFFLGFHWDFMGVHGIFCGISWKFKMGHERTFFACLTMWHLPSKYGYFKKDKDDQPRSTMGCRDTHCKKNHVLSEDGDDGITSS